MAVSEYNVGFIKMVLISIVYYTTVFSMIFYGTDVMSTMKSKRPDLFFKCPFFHRGHQIAFIVVEPEEVQIQGSL